MTDSLWTSFIANDSGNGVLVCSSADGVNWTANTPINQTSKFAPSLAVFNNRLYVAFIANDSGNGVLVCSSADGVNWTANTPINQSSKSAPYLTTFSPWNEGPPHLFVAFIANNSGNAVLVCSSADGAKWSGTTDINVSSQFAPTLAAFNGKLYVAFTSRVNQILVISSFDGVSWPNTVRSIIQSSQFGPSLAIFDALPTLNATFNGTLTITDSQQDPPTTQNLTAPFTFQGSGPWNVSVPPLKPVTFTIQEISDTVTATPGTATGTYEQNGQMNLALPVTLRDTDNFLSPNPQTVHFPLSTSGTLSMESAGSTASGSTLNMQGGALVGTLVGSANVTAKFSKTVGVGLVITGSLTGSLPPGPIFQQVAVPNVVGLEYDKAVAEVNAVGLALAVTDVETRNDIDWKRVLTQSPPGGSFVAKGSQMSLSVGTQPPGPQR